MAKVLAPNNLNLTVWAGPIDPDAADAASLIRIIEGGKDPEGLNNTVYQRSDGEALYFELLPAKDDKTRKSDLNISDLIVALAGGVRKDGTESLKFFRCVGCKVTNAVAAPTPTPTLAEKLEFGPNVTHYIPYPPFITPRIEDMRSAAYSVEENDAGTTGTSSTEDKTPAGLVTTGTDSTGTDSTRTDPTGTDPTGTDQSSSAASADTGKLGASVAGGVVGGFFAGVTIGILILWLLRRRRRQTHATSGSTMRDELVSSHSPGGKEMQNLAIPMSVTGWQKHLPQEKDDGTIARTVKSIFDQVQVHMEGFYKARPGKMNGEAVAAIEGISSVDLAKKLSKVPNGVLMLEAILIRWIVHRMSLRSVAVESFLPIEYTKIPEQNGWHMESDEHGNGHAAEAKKGRSQSATFILNHPY
jgi:hypothetical protein